MKKILAASFVFFLAIISGFFIYQTIQKKHMNVELNRLIEDIKKKDLQILVVKSDNSKLESEVQKLRSEIKSQKRTSEVVEQNSTPSTPKLVQTKSPFKEMVEKMMEDPQMKEMLKEQQRSKLADLYNPFFKKLGLKQDQIDHILDLLLANRMKGMEKGLALFAKGTTDKNQLVADLKTERAIFDQQLSELLGGDSNLAQFKEYEQSIKSRTVVDQFKAKLSSSGLTLQENQSNQLVQIMREEQLKNKSENQQDLKSLLNGEGMAQFTKNQQTVYQNVVNRAASFLSPEQTSALASFYEQQLSRQELGAKMAEKIFKSN
jgi:hypothetical protein